MNDVRDPADARPGARRRSGRPRSSTRMRELVEQGGGTGSSHEPWGRRRLAYEIDHKAEGVYHLLTFDAEPETLDEISRVLRITDGVMRHMAARRVRRAASPGRAGRRRRRDRRDPTSRSTLLPEHEFEGGVAPWPTSTASCSSAT